MTEDAKSGRAAETRHPSREGLYLLAADGVYLGEVSQDETKDESLSNQRGPYGRTGSEVSIFNPRGPYGRRYGGLSPWNTSTRTPPRLMRAGQAVALVSKNADLSERIDTSVFVSLLRTDIGRLQSADLKALQGIRGLQAAGPGHVEGSNGEFLGSLADEPFSDDFVSTGYGPFGSENSPTSVYNRYCPYGDMDSPTSAANPRATAPPRLLVRGEFVAYLTANPDLKPAVTLRQLYSWARENVPPW